MSLCRGALAAYSLSPWQVIPGIPFFEKR